MPSSPGRFWAIPAVGLAIRSLFLIPHIIVVAILAAWVYVLNIVLWIPVLFGGKYPDFAFKQVAGFHRWSARVAAYMLGLADGYPPFSLESGEYPVDLEIARAEHSNRFWAIPVLGNGIKSIILIPHLIIISVLGFVAQMASLVIWIPVLFTGKYPGWAYQLNSGYIRWNARTFLYLFGLTDKYPPFSMA